MAYQGGEKPRRDAFYDFINDKLSGEILTIFFTISSSNAFRRKDFVNMESLFIDGTKMEANANRYTFVWRGSINYHLAGLLDKIDELYERYNTLGLK